ncbi:MAG: lipid-A-disaccharide synthase [Ruminobacter sp.]|nr:lipid-A-disaccharide synthase [Ruminobacter sp.]MDY5778690.1 lipid-A-disaccharide synthase [Succinivibrionaceae bacterium]
MASVTLSHTYALVACEASGDTLGEGLMQAILKRDPEAKFVGIFGPKMRKVAQGKGELFDMEKLSVMGIGEVITALPRILYMRHKLIKTLLNLHPDVYIGIDAPDFNLTVELIMKKHDIPTVHYVSPSVWAWRQSRIYKIKAATDMVLSILPFEKAFYDKFDTPCTYVGHRLAKEIPMDTPLRPARMLLNFSQEAMTCNQVVAVLPGSRKSEIKFLVPEFAEAAYKLLKTYPVMRFICAATSYEKACLIRKLWLKHAPSIPLVIYLNQAHNVLGASNAVMIASGTATLEAMLYKKRMVVCYIVNQITAAIGRRMLKIDSYSLPNLLCGRKVVKELIQEDCTPKNIYDEIDRIFTTDDQKLNLDFRKVHRQMMVDSDEIAADTVMKIIDNKYQELIKKYQDK